MLIDIVAQDDTPEDLISELRSKLQGVFPSSLSLGFEEIGRYHLTSEIGGITPDLIWDGKSPLDSESARKVVGCFENHGAYETRLCHNLTSIVERYHSGKPMLLITHESHFRWRPNKPVPTRWRVGHFDSYGRTAFRYAAWASGDLIVIGTQRAARPRYWKAAAHEIGHVLWGKLGVSARYCYLDEDNHCYDHDCLMSGVSECVEDDELTKIGYSDPRLGVESFCKACTSAFERLALREISRSATPPGSPSS